MTNQECFLNLPSKKKHITGYQSTTTKKLPGTDGTQPVGVYEEKPHRLLQYNDSAGTRSSYVTVDFLHYVRCIRYGTDIGLETAIQELAALAKYDFEFEWKGMDEEEFEYIRTYKLKQYYEARLSKVGVWNLMKDYIEKYSDGALSYEKAPQEIKDCISKISIWLRIEMTGEEPYQL